MLRYRRFLPVLAVVLLAVSSIGGAQSFSTRKPGSTSPPRGSAPQAVACGPTTITESSSNTITPRQFRRVQLGRLSYRQSLLARVRPFRLQPDHRFPGLRGHDRRGERQQHWREPADHRQSVHVRSGLPQRHPDVDRHHGGIGPGPGRDASDDPGRRLGARRFAARGRDFHARRAGGWQQLLYWLQRGCGNRAELRVRGRMRVPRSHDDGRRRRPRHAHRDERQRHCIRPGRHDRRSASRHRDFWQRRPGDRRDRRDRSRLGQRRRDRLFPHGCRVESDGPVGPVYRSKTRPPPTTA